MREDRMTLRLSGCTLYTILLTGSVDEDIGREP